MHAIAVCLLFIELGKPVSMSEKKPGKGRGRGSRPDVSKTAPLPAPGVVENLLINAGGTSAEGIVQPVPSGNGVAERAEPTSSGKTEDSLSPTVSELKTAIKHVSLVADKPLNPSAPSFTPVNSSMLDPTSTEFTPRGMVTKQLPQSSSLNPNCPEFVPSLKSPPLNVKASVFVPKVGLPPSMQNGDMGMGTDELDDQEEIRNLIPLEEELPVLEPQDIVRGFEKVVEVSAEDQEGYDQLLTATAEMLLKATMYPGSFERLKLNITTAIQKWPPAESTLNNLGEMIIHWGITEPSLRYIACRVAQELCTVLGDKEMRFKKPLFQRLQAWYKIWKERFEKEPWTEDNKFQFINLSLFYAEVFVRVKVGQGEVPFTGLVQPIFEFIKKLLDLKEDSTVTSACHMLKLTGVYLEKADDKGTMEKIITELKSIALDQSLPRKTTDLVVRVIQLQARKWDKFGGNVFVPLASSQAAASAIAGPVASNLNTDAPPFIPSGEISFTYQQPVRNAEEWKEYFEGEDTDIIDQPDFTIEADDEGLDPEIELEMEAFIEEIEEHLMMRDFDPDLDHSQQ